MDDSKKAKDVGISNFDMIMMQSAAGLGGAFGGMGAPAQRMPAA